MSHLLLVAALSLVIGAVLGLLGTVAFALVALAVASLLLLAGRRARPSHPLTIPEKECTTSAQLQP